MTIEAGNVVPFGGAIGAGGGDGVKFEVVTELPQEGKAGIIYLLQVDGAEAPNKCEEYIWLSAEGRYEEFGPTTATPDKEGIIKFDPDSLVINDDGQLTVDGYADLKAKVDDLELFKFPNATIVGEPLINNGQIANFSTADYLMFPFELDVRDHAFTVEFAFTTSDDVTTQQNVIDSRFGIALAIKNGLGLMAVSYNGQSWGTTGEGVMAIQPNTTYYAKLSWNKLQYKTLLSTNGRDYVEDISFTSATGPFPATIFIGGGSTEALGHEVHPFKGTINLNKAYLYIDNQLIWQGMDDVGLATRLDVELGNITSAGIQAIQNIVGNPYSKTEIDEQMEEKQDKLVNGEGISISEFYPDAVPTQYVITENISPEAPQRTLTESQARSYTPGQGEYATSARYMPFSNVDTTRTFEATFKMCLPAGSADLAIGQELAWTSVSSYGAIGARIDNQAHTVQFRYGRRNDNWTALGNFSYPAGSTLLYIKLAKQSSAQSLTCSARTDLMTDWTEIGTVSYNATYFPFDFSANHTFWVYTAPGALDLTEGIIFQYTPARPKQLRITAKVDGTTIAYNEAGSLEVIGGGGGGTTAKAGNNITVAADGTVSQGMSNINMFQGKRATFGTTTKEVGFSLVNINITETGASAGIMPTYHALTYENGMLVSHDQSVFNLVTGSEGVNVTQSGFGYNVAVDADKLGNTISTGKYFSKENFEIVGTPTITADGIASEFSNTSYLQTASIALGNKTVIRGCFTVTGTPIQSRPIRFVDNTSSNAGSIYLAPSYIQTQIGSVWSGTITTSRYQQNIPIYYTFTIENESFSCQFMQDGVELGTLTGSGITGFAKDSTMYVAIGKVDAVGSYGNHTVDLKQFSITVDGVEVFSGTKKLINDGYLDGTPTDCQVVIDTFVDGTSGYRIWSDGYCEQWGFTTLDELQFVAFLKTFANTNYNIAVTCKWNSTLSASASVGNMAVNGFYVNRADNGEGTSWKACGYLAEGEY